MATIDISRLQALPLKERLAAVEALWDSIARDGAGLDVPSWHREALRQRLAAYRQKPEEGAPWPDVRRLIEKEHKSKP